MQKFKRDRLVKKAPREAKQVLEKTSLVEIADLFQRLAKQSHDTDDAPKNAISEPIFIQHFFPEFRTLGSAFFRSFDSNEDSLITWNEFVIGLAICTQSADKEAKLKLVFSMFGCSADRKELSKNDMRALLRSSFFTAEAVKYASVGAKQLDESVDLPNREDVDRRVDELVEDAYTRSRTKPDTLTWPEFLSWASTSWDIETLLSRLQNRAALRRESKLNAAALRDVVSQNPDIARALQQLGIRPSVLVRDPEMLSFVVKLCGKEARKRSRMSLTSSLELPWPAGVLYIAKALYSYEQQDNAAVTLRAGDIVHVHNVSPTGWSLGYCNARLNWYPTNYLEIVARPPGSGSASSSSPSSSGAAASIGRRATSPQHRAVSPQKRATSPRHRAVSPRRALPKPPERALSPSRTMPTLPGRATSPLTRALPKPPERAKSPPTRTLPELSERSTSPPKAATSTGDLPLPGRVAPKPPTPQEFTDFHSFLTNSARMAKTASDDRDEPDPVKDEPASESKKDVDVPPAPDAPDVPKRAPTVAFSIADLKGAASSLKPKGRNATPPPIPSTPKLGPGASPMELIMNNPRFKRLQEVCASTPRRTSSSDDEEYDDDNRSASDGDSADAWLTTSDYDYRPR
jgi:Ca2+-binding EF-hand superfamily protein